MNSKYESPKLRDDVSVTCVIPARLQATRFSEKLLQDLHGEPVIRHTVKRALEANCFTEVCCFTDADSIAEVLKNLPCSVFKTGPAENGTDRIARNMDKIKTEYIVNLQGDEPCFSAQALKEFTEEYLQMPETVAIMLSPLILDNVQDSDEIENKNRVKVLYQNERVLDFARQLSDETINDIKKGVISVGVQLGVYGYSKSYLSQYRKSDVSLREFKDSHELLRLFPHEVKVVTTSRKSRAVDNFEDLTFLRSLSGVETPK